MAYRETQIGDIKQPQVYNDYLREKSIYDSLIYKSGIVVVNPKITANLIGGSKKFSTPFWKDLILAGDATTQIPQQEVDVNTNFITSGEFDVRRQVRVQKWGANALASILSGENVMDALASYIDTYWGKAMQQLLFVTEQGILADNITNDAHDMVNDITTNDGDDAKINYDVIVDTIFKMGAKFQEITAMAIHSVPYARLTKLNIIDTQTISSQNLGFGTFFGKSIILDDYETYKLETVTIAGVSTPNTPVYWTTFFKTGAFGYGESYAGFMAVESERNPNRGGGQDFIHTRKCFALHPYGFSWTESSITSDDGDFPTDADLANEANWDRTASSVKLTGFVVLKTLG